MSTKLVMGPVLYHWPAETLRDFWFRVADEADVDTVCVGEVVCSKRMPFFEDELPKVVERLTKAGKEVVLSSLALVSDAKEEAAMRDLIAMAPGLVEANDAGILMDLKDKPHAIGPLLNIYNEEALAFLAARGAVRACLNPEVPGAVVADLAARAPMPLEVMVFGRQPLAISARCFHARAEGRTKDGCQFACGADPDGRVLRTIEEVAFLAMNGLQTLTFTCGNLVHELQALVHVGVERFRLSPQSGDMVRTAAIFRNVLNQRVEAAAAAEQLSALHPDLPFSNGFHHGAPGHRFLVPAGSEATLH
jgi:collagenase-like PrtC family protease